MIMIVYRVMVKTSEMEINNETVLYSPYISV